MGGCIFRELNKKRQIMKAPVLRTSRLCLREWRADDLEPFAQLNADPCVMKHFPNVLTRDESDAHARRIMARMEILDFGFWALEHAATNQFIGFTGLSAPSFSARFTPCVEIGWRLAAEHWGQGYVTEAARACLAYAFESLQLEEVVSFTVPANVRSRAVMERLGFRHNPSDDFMHPGLPSGHPIQSQVLYRLKSDKWREQNNC